MKLQGIHALVLGLGESGLAMARWLARQGASVRVADSRETPPNAEALTAALPTVELICGAFVPTTTCPQLRHSQTLTSLFSKTLAVSTLRSSAR